MIVPDFGLSVGSLDEQDLHFLIPTGVRLVQRSRIGVCKNCFEDDIKTIEIKIEVIHSAPTLSLRLRETGHGSQICSRSRKPSKEVKAPVIV
jgi:hypothetical protein